MLIILNKGTSLGPILLFVGLVRMPTCVKLFSLVHVLMGLLHKFT